MSTDIARLDLRLRRRSLLGYALAMAAYTFVVVAIYPTFEDDAGLDRFSAQSSTVAALFGASGSLTSPSGWLNANLYGNFLPLVVLLLTIGYGAGCIAGQDEDLTLAMVATLPVSRRGVVLAKFAVMCLQALPVSVATALCVLAGRGFDLPVAGGDLLGVTVGVLLLGVDLGALAMLVGAWTGSRGTALGVTSVVAAASYLVSSLAPAVDWLRPARVLSPFYWSVGNAQVANGLGAVSVLVLGGAAVALLALTLAAFERLDIH